MELRLLQQVSKKGYRRIFRFLKKLSLSLSFSREFWLLLEMIDRSSFQKKFKILQTKSKIIYLIKYNKLEDWLNLLRFKISSKILRKFFYNFFSKKLHVAIFNTACNIWRITLLYGYSWTRTHDMTVYAVCVKYINSSGESPLL